MTKYELIMECVKRIDGARTLNELRHVSSVNWKTIRQWVYANYGELDAHITNKIYRTVVDIECAKEHDLDEG